jgi:SOS response regulatory protein OraA/RecX
MRIVTALRERPRDRVEVYLDGTSWRLVPADAVVRTGLVVGRALDRETARELARELRRSEALGVALRALRHRDYSRSRLEARLAERGTSTATLEDALETLERVGLVDDSRVGAARAEQLAGRGFGDAAIRFALEEEGLAADVVDGALATLEPEPERAGRFLEARGHTLKTVRWLAAKGFDASTLEELGGFADGA